MTHPALVSAFVLYDNNGETPFAVYKSLADLTHDAPNVVKEGSQEAIDNPNAPCWYMVYFARRPGLPSE